MKKYQSVLIRVRLTIIDLQLRFPVYPSILERPCDQRGRRSYERGEI